MPLLHLPPGHSESKLQRPSGAFEHLPLLHFAPLPPQSESKPHELPSVFAQRPLLHFTPGPQSLLKPQFDGSDEDDDDDDDDDDGADEEDDDAGADDDERFALAAYAAYWALTWAL